MEAIMSMTRPRAIFSMEEMAEVLIAPFPPTLLQTGLWSYRSLDLLKHPVSGG